MRALLTALACLAALLAPAGALADEPAPEPPPEVLSCLAENPGAVPLGGETDGAEDVVCLADGQERPAQAEVGDVYLNGGTTTELLGPPPALPQPELPAVPLPEPAGQQQGALEPPSGVEAELVGARAGDALRLARTAGAAAGRARVTYDRAPGADGYVVKCAGQKARTAKRHATLRARAGARCKVRSWSRLGSSDWSRPVRVRR